MVNDDNTVKVDPDEFFSGVAATLLYPLRDWENHCGYRPQAVEPLLADGRELIERAIGGPLNLNKVIPILMQKCGCSEESLMGMQWSGIVEAFRVYLDSGQEKRKKPDGDNGNTTPPGGAQAKIVAAITKHHDYATDSYPFTVF